MSAPRIFLSYARTDLEAARELRQQLEAELGQGAVWHDVRDLAGDHWWTEIEDTIRGRAPVEHVVLLASTEALTREVVRREWRLAWREGKTVSNVFWSARPGFSGPDFANQPGWIKAKSMLDLSLPDRWQALIGRLKGSGQTTRRPFMVPAMPEGFVERREEFDKLKAALLDAKGDAIAITATLRGAGGFGKTVLAQALGNDADIQDAFYDGVLWVTLGERPNLVEKLASLLETLTGKAQPFHEAGPATNKLKELLENRRCLLVIDDVWNESELRPFLEGAPLTARLVTTRRDDILPAGTVRVPVDAMTEAEAVELLSQGVGEVTPAEHAALRTLAKKRLGEWPVIIRLVNGFLRKEVERGVTPLEAIRQANDRLDRKELAYFDRNDEKAREAAVESTVRAGLDYLVEEIGRGRNPKVYSSQRYGELAVFPEDVEVPIGTIARLWRHVAEIDEIETRDLLKDLYSLALLQALDLKRGTMRLHDVMRKYLIQQCAADEIKGMHHQLVEAYDAMSGPDIEDTEERRYFYAWLPTHLAEAGEQEALDDLLLDPQWMQRKPAEVGILSLLTDYRRLARERDTAQWQVGQTLGLVGGTLARDQHQIMPQLLGRLSGEGAPRLTSFLERARSHLIAPALVPRRPTFALGGGAELKRFSVDGGIGAVIYLGNEQALMGCTDGRLILLDLISGTSRTVVAETPPRQDGELSGWVCALAMLPDGRVLVGSEDDGTVRLWDLTTDTSRVLKGHTSRRVAALAVLPDGRVLSGSTDDTIRLWDLATSTARVLRGHTREVVALVALPDGRALSAGYDSLRLWDLAAGTSRVLEGPAAGVSALALLPDGRIVSAAEFDGTVWLWDLATGTGRLVDVDSGGVMALAALPDGRVLSAARDHTLRLLDLASGETRTFEGHTSWVTSLAVLPSGRALSGSTDNTVRLWDLARGGSGRRAKHPGRVNALAVLPDGRVLSAGEGENTMRLWDSAAVTNDVFDGHTGEVTALIVLPDGHVLSSSRDHTLRLWDLAAGTSRVFEGHTDTVTTLALLADGRLLSGSMDETVRLWDLATGTVRVLDKRRYFSTDRVSVLAALPDGRVLFGNGWDLQVSDLAGGETLKLENLRGMHRAIAALPDGRVLLGSWDRTVQLWDIVSGTGSNLEGSMEWNGVVAPLPDGHALLVGSRDRSLRLWDLNPGRATYGTQLAGFEGDGEFSCLAVLPDGRGVVAGDELGYLHWLEIVE